MTTRALVRTGAFDHDRVRRSLHDSALSRSVRLGDHEVNVYVEPLLRHDGSGGLLQSVRLTVTSDRAEPNPTVDRVVAKLGDSTLPVTVEQSPHGTRLLVPAVSKSTEINVELPNFAAGQPFTVTLEPQRKWTVHLVHHSHLDIGYTDPQGTVLKEHLSYLDDCLDLTTETDSWPEEAQFRWCVEALWSLRRWERYRSRNRIDEFYERVRQGRIELTAMPFNLHTETCSTDELHELLRMARDTHRQYGVEFTSAMQTDVPGSVVGLPDVLAANGIRYLSVAHNWAGRSVPHLVGGDRLPRLFRWRTPAGSSVLVWVTDTPHGMAYMEGPMLGFDRSYAMVDELFPEYLTSLATHPYPYNADVFGWPHSDAPVERDPYPWDVLHLRVQGTFADNAPPRRIMAETVRRWNETWAYPKLRLSRNEDFFADAESRYGDQIQTFEGDWTDWWADGIGSGARPLALTRRAQGMLADAQTISAMSGLVGAADTMADTFDSADIYQNASLFNEHTWGAADPWTHGDHSHGSGEEQWHWKYSKALAAHDDAESLVGRAASRLGDQLGADPAALVSFHVTNTCSWERTDVVRIFLAESVVPLEAAVVIRDGRTGADLPHDEQPQMNPDHRDAGRFLLVRVADVPPIGTVRLDIHTGSPSDGRGQPAVVETADREILENEFLRVRLDPTRAAIASIVDKSTGREWINQDSTVGFNGYLYDTYGSAGGHNHMSSRLTADDKLSLLGPRAIAEHAAIVSRTDTATGVEIVTRAIAPGATELRTTYRLPYGVARLDIENRISKQSTLTKESGFFAFPFAMDAPEIRTELTGGVSGTGLPVVPGSALHFRTIRRWATVSQDGGTAAWVTQDAPLVQLGDIALPYAPFPGTLPTVEPGTIYSWVHNNLWDTNFPSEQAFETTFRYSVAVDGGPSTSDGPVAAPAVLGIRTAAAGSRELRAVRGEAGETGPASRSLLSIDDDRVRLVGFTVPRQGQVLARLQSFAEEPTEVALTPAFAVRAARATTYLADPIEDGEIPIVAGRVSIPLAPLSTEAILLETE